MIDRLHLVETLDDVTDNHVTRCLKCKMVLIGPEPNRTMNPEIWQTAEIRCEVVPMPQRPVPPIESSKY